MKNKLKQIWKKKIITMYKDWKKDWKEDCEKRLKKDWKKNSIFFFNLFVHFSIWPRERQHWNSIPRWFSTHFLWWKKDWKKDWKNDWKKVWIFFQSFFIFFQISFQSFFQSLYMDVALVSWLFFLFCHWLECRTGRGQVKKKEEFNSKLFSSVQLY